MSALDERPFPKAAIFGAAALIGLTTLGVGMVQFQKFHGSAPVEAAQTVPVVQSRHVRFVDHGGAVSVFGGAVSVYDADSGDKIGDLRPNDGFVRAVLNSLAFERTRQDIAGDPVLMLQLRSDNRLLITDAATGKSVNLNAFGMANRSVFLRFLPDGGRA